MAKKTPLAKPTQVFNYIYMITWALLPLVYFVYEDKAQDPGLFPRHMLLSISVFISAILLLTKKTRELPFRLTLAAISFFVLWHFAGYSTAYAKTELLATFARNGLMLSYLLLTFQLLRNQLLSFKAIIRGIILFASISAFSLIPDFTKLLDASNDSVKTVYDVHGLFSHKNFAASALLLTIPFLYLGTRDKNSTWRIVAILALGLTIVEIVVLRTRGVWIGFLSGVGTTVLLQILSKQKANGQLKWVGIGTAAFAILISLVFLTGNNAEKILNRGNIDVRLIYWKKCVEMAQDHPITGVGAGNWKINFPGYGLKGTNESVMTGFAQISRPHNDMLQVLSEMGIPAWIAIALFQLYLLFICVKLLNHTDGEKRNYAMAGIFALVAFAAYGLGEFPMERTVAVGMLVLIAAETLRLGEEEGILKKPIFILPANALNVLIILLAVVGLWIGNARVKGEISAQKAVVAYTKQNSPNMLKYGQEAENRFFAIDVYNSPMAYFRGLGFAATNRLPQAVESFKEGLKISPYHINSIRQLGDIYKFQKKYDQALKMYNQSLAISPMFYYANLSKAEIYLLQQNTKEALKCLLRVSPTVDYPKNKAIGVEILNRIARSKNEKFNPAIMAIAIDNSGNNDQLWNEFIAWRMDNRKAK